MEFGVHLPLISFMGEQRSLDDLLAVRKLRTISVTRLRERPSRVLASVARRADGAAVLAHSGRRMTLATTVAVPVLVDRRQPQDPRGDRSAVRRPAGGRAGPGSSARDCELVGVSFEERWKRLDEAVQTLRAYWRGDDVAFEGTFYSSAGFTLEPTPAQRPGPADLDRELGIGGRAETRGAPCRRLASLRQHDPGAVRPGLVGRPGGAGGAQARCGAFPNGIATMWCYVTEDQARAEAVLADLLAPLLNRPVEPLGRSAHQFGGGMRNEAAGVRACGRATRLSVAARRRARPAGDVPRTRRATDRW